MGYMAQMNLPVTSVYVSYVTANGQACREPFNLHRAGILDFAHMLRSLQCTEILISVSDSWGYGRVATFCWHWNR